MSSFGKLYLSSIIATQDTHSFLEQGNLSDLFTETEMPLYSFVKEFSKKYGKLPDVMTFHNHTKEDLPEASEPGAYYRDLMVSRYHQKALKKTLKDVEPLLSGDSPEIEKAVSLITGVALDLMAKKNGSMVADFRTLRDLIISAYVAAHNNEKGDGLSLGWPSFDNLSGGLVRGDVISFVGRPARGKTWQLLYAAMHGWLETQKAIATFKAKDASDLAPKPQSRMFVSMEMRTLPIAQRMVAMKTHLPITKLKQGNLESKEFKTLKKGLTEIEGYSAPFWIVDGNLAATVEDIWMLAQSLKPDAIFIDGAYLLKHPTERDRYKRVAENVELIKQQLAPIAPVCCSWQFARSAAKKNKKQGEKADLDDIGYTDAIGQVSSIVLGLLEDESIETLNRRVISILKGRNGETGSFKTNWRFDYSDKGPPMDFSEYIEKEAEDLQFM